MHVHGVQAILCFARFQGVTLHGVVQAGLQALPTSAPSSKKPRVAVLGGYAFLKIFSDLTAWQLRDRLHE